MGDGFVYQEEKCADGFLEVVFGSVFFFAVGKAAGGVGEHHDDGHVGDHFGGVVERARGELGGVTGDFADGFLAKAEEIGIEGAGLDAEEVAPLDSDIVFLGKTAGSALCFMDHGGEDFGVEGALIDGDFRDAGDGGDDAGFHLDDAGGANDAGAGLRIPAGDFAALESCGCGGEKSVTAHGDGRGAGVGGLADEADHVAREAKGAEDNSGGFVHGFEDTALFDVEFQIGFGVDALERLVSAEHGAQLDTIFAEDIFDTAALRVGERANLVELEAGGCGRRAQKAAAETRAFLIGPIHELESDRGFGSAGIAAERFEGGDDAESSIEPAAVRHGIEMAAEDDGLVRGAGDGDPVVAGGVGDRRKADSGKFAAKPFASGAPYRAPG